MRPQRFPPPLKCKLSRRVPPQATCPSMNSDGSFDTQFVVFRPWQRKCYYLGDDAFAQLFDRGILYINSDLKVATRSKLYGSFGLRSDGLTRSWCWLF